MKDVIQALVKFRDERNWAQFHTPENIAKSIVLEAAELLENFQWGNKKTNVENIKEELADVLTYCLYMCEKFDFDVKEIVLEKMKTNELKYPVDKSYGKSTKYNQL